MIRTFALNLRRPALVLALCTAVAFAQSPAEPPSYDFGFEQRVRNEDWNNITDYGDRLGDERQQIRYRTRAWMKAPLSQTIDFFVGLNQETNQRFGQVNRFDEVIFESAYLDFKRLFVNGLALRVGRQNLMRGEGFILLEGNPWDGSRTIYFNAADLSYTRGRSKIELIGILNPVHDRFLPRLHDRQKCLIDWDERALAAYFTHASGLETYYFYKRETNALIPPPSGRVQPDRHIHTFGSRGVRRPRPGWTVTGELAAQWGFERPASDIHAWGGYAHVKRSFETHPWKPYVLGGYWGMSGDDPSTPGRNEGWDPLFARWPKWSELYLYSYMRERGPGYWTNLGMCQAEVGAAARKNIGLKLTYYRMNSFHPFRGDARVFGEGTRRGDNLQARMDFSIGRNWKGHAMYETLLPGSFYRERNAGYFARFELSYTITGHVHAGEFRRALATR